MSLIRGQEVQSTVAMLSIIPADKSQGPFSSLVPGSKSFQRVVRSVFTRSKDRFRIRIIVANSRSTAGWNDT